MTQVLSTGQTAAHCGASKWPMHSVHFLGSITKVPFFSEIATLGHSGSQAEQFVHCDAMIFNAIVGSYDFVIAFARLTPRSARPGEFAHRRAGHAGFHRY